MELEKGFWHVFHIIFALKIKEIPKKSLDAVKNPIFRYLVKVWIDNTVC